MPGFNPDDYVDVQTRITRFWQEYPDGAIRTVLASDPEDFKTCRYRAEVYKQRDNQQPDATGYAFEIAGTGMANKTSHEENCETSSIGRALANMGYATSGKDRPSRQEMAKTQNMATRAPQAVADATNKPHTTPAKGSTVASAQGVVVAQSRHIDAPPPKDMRGEALGRTLHAMADHDFLHALATKWGFASFAAMPADNRQRALDYLNGKGDAAKIAAFNAFVTSWEQANQRSARKAPEQGGLLPTVDEVPNPDRFTR